MARMRQIKPEFFLDDELDRLSEVHQKLFIGLWCLSDVEGRLVDNPRKIKAQLFPYRDYDMDPLLDDLHNAGFIARYSVAGADCIQVMKFKKHQKPHPKEAALGLPNPPENIPSRENKLLAVKKNGEQLPPNLASRRDPALMENGSLENGSLESGEPQNAKPPQLPRRPDDPFASGEAFFANLQHERHAAGYVTERPPHHRAVSSWWSEFMGELNDDSERATATLKNFLRSEYWRPKNFPFPAFMKHWRDFVPRKALAS